MVVGGSSDVSSGREAELRAFETRLGHRFSDLALLDRALTHEMKEKMRAALDVLDDREEQIIRLRFGIGHDEAIQLLTLAFAGEILERVPVFELRECLEKVVAARLAAIADPEGPE